MAQQVGKILAGVMQRTGEVLELLKDAAIDLSWDMRDSAESGFGVPKLISSAASLGVAGVAAAGTGSLCMELAGKFIGRRECNTCTGWEALRCTSCGGSGKVQYVAKNFDFNEADKPTSESIAMGIKQGTILTEHFPPTFNMGLPFPLKSCPTCDGTGVITCTDCKGESWKAKFSADEVLNVPWKTWDVYRKTKAPEEGKGASMADPGWAAFNLFGRRELEEGIEYDKDVKEKLMWQWKDARKYDEVRDLVAMRETGWEEMQKLLTVIDPDRAMQDPIIVRNVPYFKARQQIEAEVAKLEVPPRPADWEYAQNLRLPLEDSDWTDEELSDRRKLAELRVLLKGQESFLQETLDTEWESQWREQKVKEIVQEKVNQYLTAGPEQPSKSAEASSTEVSSKKVGQPSAATSKTRAAAPQKAAASKKQTEDEKKKKERLERAERMAKQAAEREAALERAKGKIRKS